MLLQVSTKGNWFNQVSQQIVRLLTPPVPLERPNLSLLAQPDADLPRFVAECAVARKYLDLLGSLDWAHFPGRDLARAWPGPQPVPRACFAAAYLIKLDQQKRYMPDLRKFLVEHPALVWIPGFPLVPSPAYSRGFDAFYVYQYFHDASDDLAHGFAAVSLSERRGVKRAFDAEGLPLCQARLPMPLKSTFICHTTAVEHERGRYVCPLLYPHPTGEVCPSAHKNWPKGGCILTMPTCPGARIRYQLDRQSLEFKAAYKQRTATERINSQAVELDIERPKLRNGQAITKSRHPHLCLDQPARYSAHPRAQD